MKNEKIKQYGLWEPGTVRLNTMIHLLHQSMLNDGINVYELDQVTIRYVHQPDTEDVDGGQLPAFTEIKVSWDEEQEESGS